MDDIRWLDELSPAALRIRLEDLGCVGPVRVKFLVPNNNSKNQIYLASDLSELAWLPKGPQTSAPRVSAKAKNRGQPLGHATVPFHWLTESGAALAPSAQVINYPQYPEVRLSGLLKGAMGAPRELLVPGLRGREPGRVLILATTTDGRAVGALFPSSSIVARHLRDERDTREDSLLHFWNLLGGDAPALRAEIVRSLWRVHRLGFVPGERLLGDGSVIPYDAPNAAGYTLERHLGVPSNAENAPDLYGWEIKQHGRNSSRITIFDVVPDGGAFVENTPLEFHRRFGRATSADRYDFNGTAAVGRPSSSGFELLVRGFDGDINPSGSVELHREDEVVMSWSFLRLSDRWASKHQRTAFLESESATIGTTRAFRYSPIVTMAEGARFSRFLSAVDDGRVVVDPACRLVRSGTGRWRHKVRSAFRVRVADVATLYSTHEVIDLRDVDAA